MPECHYPISQGVEETVKQATGSAIKLTGLRELDSAETRCLTANLQFLARRAKVMRYVTRQRRALAMFDKHLAQVAHTSAPD
jgi:hypothetical protein